MSDNWLQFIPDEPTFQPTLQAAENARTLLHSFLPNSDEINIKFMESVTFFDPGSNWSGVECPACNTNIEEWWPEAMGVAAENDFQDLMTVTPCCSKKISLNNLKYIWAVAFGRFVLEAQNPNIQDFPIIQKTQLEKILGCTLRQVWMHL